MKLDSFAQQKKNRWTSDSCNPEFVSAIAFQRSHIFHRFSRKKLLFPIFYSYFQYFNLPTARKSRKRTILLSLRFLDVARSNWLYQTTAICFAYTIANVCIRFAVMSVRYRFTLNTNNMIYMWFTSITNFTNNICTCNFLFIFSFIYLNGPLRRLII